MPEVIHSCVTRLACASYLNPSLTGSLEPINALWIRGAGKKQQHVFNTSLNQKTLRDNVFPLF